MKVYTVVEKFTQDTERLENEVIQGNKGVFSAKEKAIEQIKKLHDEQFDVLTGEDENNTSAVSYDKPWDGDECVLEDENCSRWVWTVEENELDKEC